MHSRPQIEGLKPSASLVAISELVSHCVQNALIVPYRLAYDERLGLLEHGANFLSSRDLSHTGAPIVISDDDKISRKERTMGAAQVKQHAVMTSDRNHPHGDYERRCG